MVSHYVQVNVSLSNQQLNKIKNAARNGTGVSIRIGRNMLNKSGNMMYLTKTQLEKINRSKNPVTINFSASQLKFLVSGGTAGDFAEYLISKGFKRFVSPRIKSAVDKRVPKLLNKMLRK